MKNANYHAQLSEIHKAILNNPSDVDYIYVTADKVNDLGNARLIDLAIAPQVKDLIAISITDEGYDFLKKGISIEKVESDMENGTDYKIRRDIPVTAIKKKGRKTEKYPFSLMSIGDSFHVPISDDMPEPGKTLQTTVSSATSRFKIPDTDGAVTKNRNGEIVPIMVETKKFTLRTVDSTDPDGPGARVYRTK